ncbi:MAG: dihydroorotate dehydrogenase electron transfer subunit, partial [Candidatus Cloacimonetes bacterium]|nr:dihydroorotate dehydrogenase electron transfer subunit [Candidatus Cloacimonadota bacterium]
MPVEMNTGSAILGKTFITRLDRLSIDYFIVWVKAYEKMLDAIPGQFFEIKIPGSDLSLLRKPISIYDIRDEEIGFMIKRIGYGTDMLSKAKEGQILDIIGPLGNGFSDSENKDILLISGGIGYAPLFYLKRKLERKNNVVWMHGGRTKNDVFHSCNIIYTDDGSSGIRGLVTDGLELILAEKKFAMIYCCGPDQMMKRCSEIASKLNCEMEVSLEEYMGCGIGACYGCVVSIREDNNTVYKRVCKEGPVFK